MPEETPNSTTTPAPTEETALGPTMARSVFANWVWYFVVVVSGFLLPRLVDRRHGQELLGIWDFGWSLVVYINLLAAGVGGAVNRYIARFRRLSDWSALNATVNSALLLLCASACLGALVAGVFVVFAPALLGDLSPDRIATARWAVALLSITCVVQLPGGVFNGIITGYERFDLLNAIRVPRDLLVLISSIVALFNGYGIVTLAGIVLCGEVFGEVAKVILSRRLCSQLALSPAHCRRAVMRDLLSFGGKNVVLDLARGGIYQGSGLLVAAFLGPMALATFARQRALVMHLMRFVKQYAQVFIPRSSALDAAGDRGALRASLITTSRAGLYITLPPVLLLVVMGAPLLNLWMGSVYEAPWVLCVMAVGHLGYVAQLGVYSILLGMGRHGVAAWLELGAMVSSVGMGLLILGPLDGDLLGAAIAMAVPLAVSGGILLPAYACRVLQLPLRRYIAEVAPGPLRASIPLACCLVVARIALLETPLVSLLVGVVAGGAATTVVYWRTVIPVSVKGRLRRGVSRA